MQPADDNRVLQIGLRGPICTDLLRDDAIVVDRDGWYRTISPSSPFPADNEVLISALDEARADEQIAEIIAEYRRLGRTFRWCVYSWTTPADLGARLSAYGASDYGVKVFVADTSLPLQTIDGVVVEQVASEDDDAFEAYIALTAGGWKLPAEEVAFRRQRYRPMLAGPRPRLQLFTARCDGVAAGCCATIVKSDYGYMTGAYIDPAYQGRGLFQSLLAAQHQGLRAIGIETSCGHAFETGSARWLERFGFPLLFTYRIYKFEPAATGTG